MKKLAIGILGLALSSSALAKETWCGYKDYFHLANNVNAGVYIFSGYSDSDLYLEIIGPRSFVIRDTSLCSSGYAHVSVGYDAYHWCMLNIKDGPLMNHPTIEASCSGMRFNELKYDGFGTYSYAIDVE